MIQKIINTIKKLKDKKLQNLDTDFFLTARFVLWLGNCLFRAGIKPAAHTPHAKQENIGRYDWISI